MLLENKKCLITGATGGIGRAVCDTFLKNGAELFITNITQQSLIDYKEELLQKYPNAKINYKTCNLTDKESIYELVKTANETMDGIDVLVGNAGMNMDNLTIKMTDEQWQKVIDVNLTANFILSRECIKIMIKKRYGKIVNMASVVGLTGNIGQVNYSASKSGLIAMTKCIAQEYASRNITANCVAPGFIDTPMTQAVSQEAKNIMFEKIPMKKLGSTTDVANAVLFLSSDLSSYITGETLSVNGGMLMR